jgi:rod shape-determining protein MreD
MLLGLFIYTAWVVELSGLTRTAEGLCWPCWLHMALIFVIWHKSGVSAVLWGAIIGLLLDLASGQVGVHMLLAGTLAMAASDWREGRRCEHGPTLAILATLVVASILLASQLWKAMPAREFPPAAEIAAMTLGPAASAALTALVLRWSLQASRLFVRTALGQGAGAEA